MSDEMIDFTEDLGDIDEMESAKAELRELEGADEMLRAICQLKEHPAGEHFVAMLADRLYETSMDVINTHDSDMTNILKGRCRELKEMIELIAEADEKFKQHEAQKAYAREAIRDVEEGNTH